MLSVKRKLCLGLCATLCAVATLPLGACTTDEVYTQNYYVMGTYAKLTVSAKGCSQKKFDGLSARVEEFLYSAESSLSASRIGSCVYDFNGAGAGERVEIDKTTYDVLTQSLALYSFTGGKFNPAIWHNLNAYHFAVDAGDDEQFAYLKENNELPDQKYIDRFNELSAEFEELYLEQSDGKYYATKPSLLVSAEGDSSRYSMRIDLGGIAKGWCADRVFEMMTDAGIKYGYFNFGRSSMAVKRYAGNSEGSYSLFTIDPRGDAQEDAFEIKIKDASLSTSGDYERYYEKDGVRYCHIIDPATGAPIRTGVASVTVIGKSGAEADALTDALSAMDRQSAVNFINEKLVDCKVAMLIFEGETGKIITNCPDEIKLLGAKYEIGNTVTDGKIVLN